MKARRFFWGVLAGTAAVLAALVLLLAIEDPFFVLRGIDEDDTALFSNQRYEMAGLIRHQDYTQVVMGTSLVANFQASWFTEGTGEDTLKITFPDGWITEFDTALRLAFRTHKGLDRVYFCLDPNILIRPDSERTVELPKYLYNSNPFDDVEYLFNADSYALALNARLLRQQGRCVTLDEAYLWAKRSVFSKEMALASYPRPEVSGSDLPGDAYLEIARENLDLVCAWAEEHPDTEFSIWFPPYSILYWDKLTREGREDAVLNAVEYAAQRLMEYDNVSVYCFLHNYNIIVDLYNYTDHVHCSGDVCRIIAGDVMAGRWRLTEENLLPRLEKLRGYVKEYDYEALFEGWNPQGES